ncbi:MAG: hypothetical protein JO087_08425 [Actinobacteria bacterium]|nr:hypothetical protein [Actinomycetota bacterium]
MEFRWVGALPLLARLDLRDPQTLARVWILLEARTDRDEPVDPHMCSVYASAVAAAIGVADKTMLDDEPPAELTQMISAVLALNRPLGQSVRNVVAANLSWLIIRAQTWTEGHRESLVGDDGTDDLGAYTFEAYLQRGRPSRELLRRCEDRIWAAISTTPAAAHAHILHGMLWGVDGYDPATVMDKLAASGVERPVSDAAQWLWTAATRDPTLDIEPIVKFWEEAITRALSPENYEGFGNFATIDSIDDETWLDLTLKAAILCNTGVALPNRVAKRASHWPDDPRALRLVPALLRSKVALWYVYDIGRVGETCSATPVHRTRPPNPKSRSDSSSASSSRPARPRKLPDTRRW